MSHQTYEIQGELRQKTGKGASRKIRKNGGTPAIIYGDNQAPIPITLSCKDLHQRIYAGRFLTTIATIKIGNQTIQVLPKEFALHPVKDYPLHVDFLRINKDTEVNVKVPIHFINEDKSPGIKRGGTLNIVSHEIELHCLANAIPEFITINLEGLEIGASIHASSISLPKGTRLVSTESDLTILTIAGTSGQDEGTEG